MKRALKGYPGLYRDILANDINRYRILINHDKNITQEYFFFRDSDTEAKAKKAAIKRWHELRKIYPVITKRRFCEIPRHPTPSGITGVTRIITEVKGREYEFWKAVWTTTRGKRGQRSFSINKYGEDEAKRLAIEARQDALDEIGVE